MILRADFSVFLAMQQLASFAHFDHFLTFVGPRGDQNSVSPVLCLTKIIQIFSLVFVVMAVKFSSFPRLVQA